VFDPSAMKSPVAIRAWKIWPVAAADSPMRGGPPRHRGWIDSLLPDRVIRQALTLDGKRYTLVLVLPQGREYFRSARHPSSRNYHCHPDLGTDVLSAGMVHDQPGLAPAQSGAEPRSGRPERAHRSPANGRRDELTELMRDFDRMAERIEGLVDSQSRLLKDVSHELRSPLARLSVALGLARQRATADAPPELELR